MIKSPAIAGSLNALNCELNSLNNARLRLSNMLMTACTLYHRYCQCFAAKVSCSSSCRCLTCENTDDHVEQKMEAIKGIMERNPHAFDSKFKAADTIGMNTSGIARFIPIQNLGFSYFYLSINRNFECHCT